jgi:hypothetical protein
LLIIGHPAYATIGASRSGSAAIIGVNFGACDKKLCSMVVENRRNALPRRFAAASFRLNSAFALTGYFDSEALRNALCVTS